MYPCIRWSGSVTSRRSGGGDPVIIVAETVDALIRLCPAPSELVSLCRNLVDRNPTCGPLWWLCAHLLARPESIPGVWRLAEEVERDATPVRLAEELPDGATVMTVGYPAIAARALRRCGNVSVLAVLAGDEGVRFVRGHGPGQYRGRASRPGVDAGRLPPGRRRAGRGRGMLDRGGRRFDRERPRRRRRAAADVPVWLVAGRGRRLPVAYVEGISGGLDAEFEGFSTACVSKVTGPDSVLSMSNDALAAECPAVPELLPHLTDGCLRGRNTKTTTAIKCSAVSGEWRCYVGGGRSAERAAAARLFGDLDEGRRSGDSAPTVARSWSESGRTRKGVPGATPMP